MRRCRDRGDLLLLSAPGAREGLTINPSANRPCVKAPGCWRRARCAIQRLALDRALVGSARVFEKAGFAVVAERKAGRPLMRLEL